MGNPNPNMEGLRKHRHVWAKGTSGWQKGATGDPAGRWQKGQTGNPAGRPKDEALAMLKSKAPEVMQRLLDVFHDPDTDHPTVARIGELLLNRIYGRPVQAISGPNGEALPAITVQFVRAGDSVPPPIEHGSLDVAQLTLADPEDADDRD